jgi:hypothetical protein
MQMTVAKTPRIKSKNLTASSQRLPVRVATLALLFSLSRARFFALIYECGNLDRQLMSRPA